MSLLFGRQSVDHTSELDRIIQIPRRTWTEEELRDLASDMTALLKTPNGTMTLRPMQALALHDLYCHGGLAALMRVGAGKTIVSLLAPYMVDAVRPLLLLPAALIGKTETDLQRLRQHWRIPGNIRMLSYEMLGREQSALILCDPDNPAIGYRPDLIVADEVQRLKNKKAGRTRRVTRYMREYPDTKFVGMSGTFMKHSIKDFAHVMRWCLPKDAPIPRTDGEVSEWADCLDVKVNPIARRKPGALLKLCMPAELADPPLQAARKGFQRRLTETAGVVSTAGEGVACSLYINALPYDLGPGMDEHFANLRNLMVTPDGWDLMMAAEVWATARQMALGFHGVWVPRPPKPWQVSRKIWAKFVRDQLSATDKMDTELQVKNACKRGDLPDQEYRDWMAMEPTYEIRTKDIWHDDAALNVAADWMAKGPGLVWCAHVFFAEELARRTGAEYYRQDGKNKAGQHVEKADCTKAIIVSYDSCKEGLNLQGDASRNWPGFSRNLITACPSGADDFEQLLGRTHRDGQLADEVTVDIMLGCKEHADSFRSVLEGAAAARDMLGQPQKVLIADVTFPSAHDIELLQGRRWRSDLKK